MIFIDEIKTLKKLKTIYSVSSVEKLGNIKISGLISDMCGYVTTENRSLRSLKKSGLTVSVA